MTIYYDIKGSAFNLADGVLAQGGEGSIFAIKGRPDVVAKIYRSSMTAAELSERKAKVEAMTGSAKPSSENIAWPLFALYEDAKCASFAGFAMKRVASGKGVDDLYAYPGPNISMRDKVSLARSIAELTYSIHNAGHVIGDYNDSNLVVLANGSVALVDCDSFDIRSGASHYPCTVCMPGYNAPEVLRAVKGSDYETAAKLGKTVFTRQSDHWALAVHIFRILMNGCHPYHCAALPDSSGSYPAPIKADTRVERGETPFFKKVSGVKIPPFAPETSAFPGYLVDMFKAAFVEGHRNPDKRPDAAQWVLAMDRFEKDLTPCHSNLAHFYWKGAKSCPYCAADQRVQGNQPVSARHATVNTVSASKKPVPAVTSSNVAAKTQPAIPAQAAKGNRIGKAVYWTLSITSAALIAALTCALPPMSGLFGLCFGTVNATVLWVMVFAGALAAAIAYGCISQNDTYKGVGLSSVSAAGGAIASVPLVAIIWVVLKAIFGALLVAAVLAGLVAMALDL